jgi:hypothetical protein
MQGDDAAAWTFIFVFWGNITLQAIAQGLDPFGWDHCLITLLATAVGKARFI